MVKSYIFLIVTVVIFSGNLLIGKAINDLPPVTITFFRCLIAFSVVLPFAIKQVRWYHDVFRQYWKYLLVFALTGITTFNVLVYLSLNYTTAINAGIVEATTPIFAVILGYFILKERLSKRQLLGMFISFVGAVWVISDGSVEVLMSLQFNTGDMTMLLAVLVWAIYSISVKQHNEKFPVYGSAAFMLGFGVIILLPSMFIEWFVVGLPSALGELSNWLGLFYLGVFPSFIALVLWNQAVTDIGPSLSSVFLNLLPVFTAIGAVLFFGEDLTIEQTLGGLLVILGVLLVNVNFRNIKYFRKREEV
ncbi:DMT family transporter [Alkalibacillus aidingensis]|uniref:DMT family transporter n=1 Tax=Alkalibacillus aidingensis TaxID=2747607 RepID=UPI0016600799|nr:EamA family transporter [Alkalibacillus aidingensis]